MISNTQYAALGLWVASKSGLRVPAQAWNRLIEGTFRFREAPHLVDAKVTKRTSVGKVEVAGFGYRVVKSGKQTATGSMTTAGVSILKICEIGLGKKLRPKARRLVNSGIEAGVTQLQVAVRSPRASIKGDHGWPFGQEV